ncbi:MAG TPA: hypothetical protein VGC27_02520 [Rhizomicrobium sp.]
MRITATVFALCLVIPLSNGCAIAQQSGASEVSESTLLKIASDAIETKIWKGATPEAKYAVIVDQGDKWEIDYRYPPPRRPVVGRVVIDKKTMQVTRIDFNE